MAEDKLKVSARRVELDEIVDLGNMKTPGTLRGIARGHGISATGGKDALRIRILEHELAQGIIVPDEVEDEPPAGAGGEPETETAAQEPTGGETGNEPAVLPSGSRFCPHCGTPVEYEQGAETVECQSCGRTLLPSWLADADGEADGEAGTSDEPESEVDEDWGAWGAPREDEPEAEAADAESVWGTLGEPEPGAQTEQPGLDSDPELDALDPDPWFDEAGPAGGVEPPVPGPIATDEPAGLETSVMCPRCAVYLREQPDGTFSCPGCGYTAGERGPTDRDPEFPPFEPRPRGEGRTHRIGADQEFPPGAFIPKDREDVPEVPSAPAASAPAAAASTPRKPRKPRRKSWFPQIVGLMLVAIASLLLILFFTTDDSGEEVRQGVDFHTEALESFGQDVRSMLGSDPNARDRTVMEDLRVLKQQHAECVDVCQAGRSLDKISMDTFAACANSAGRARFKGKKLTARQAFIGCVRLAERRLAVP